ncbi:MAG: GMC family oxidoreductase [Methylococcales bacterium]|nr:GMC family oxidoreductase [Methylococcales bacterium]
MQKDFDVCVVGSGAGGGPIAYTLAKAGYSVVVIEKGSWLTEKDFFKDERACCLRDGYTSDLKKEQHVIELEMDEGGWQQEQTRQSSWNLWNGNCVGGSSNFMSGFFHRLKPMDFKLLSTFGPIEGANVVDWPISYDDLEPYYQKVEEIVGVSGKVSQHPHAEPRSTANFPYPPTQEHPFASMIDQSCSVMGINSLTTSRAILSTSVNQRNACSYNGYCGSYGCATGAKGSSRAALLNQAVSTGKCQIIANTAVHRLICNHKNKITEVECVDSNNRKKHIQAKIFVIACQAVETSRLLLLSANANFPNGLVNNHGQVGKNLLFAGGGAGSGRFDATKLNPKFKQIGTFINRNIQDWYVIDDPEFGVKQKGGTIDFINIHPNPVIRASRQTSGHNGLLWGKPLKRKLETHFIDSQYIKIEAFCDWLPINDCFVSLDPVVKDHWNRPVAKTRLGFHVRNLQVGWYLANKGASVLKQMGAEDVVSFAVGSPPTNLMAGGCRFGDDPKTSVLNKYCQAHDIDNLFVTDGSFMPNAGSAPYTWTIYANSFRVADYIIKQL